MSKREFSSLIVAPSLAVLGLLLALLLLGWSTAGAAPGKASPLPNPLAQDNTFTVSGTVTCQGLSLPEVEVFVWYRDQGHGVLSDTTDNNGDYHVVLEGGEYYDLIFNPPCGSGCASQALKGVTGPPNQTLDVDLPSGYSVSGTAYATDGTTPISDVAIYAFNHETADGFGLPLTNDFGHYCIGLIAGMYDLGFSPPSCREVGPKTKVITLSQDVPLDVVLPPGFTVAGRVTDGTGSPVLGVQIYARECYTSTGYGFTPSNVGGDFTGTLPLGTYGIQLLPPADQGLGPQTITDVVSTSASCPNASLDVALPAGVTISGQITCQRRPIKNIFVYADPIGPSPDCYGLDGAGVYSVDDGSFALPVISGTYDIRLVPPPATGLNELVFTDVQVLEDKYLTVDLCPVIYLPIVMKDHTVPTVLEGWLRFSSLEGGCWSIEDGLR